MKDEKSTMRKKLRALCMGLLLTLTAGMAIADSDGGSGGGSDGGSDGGSSDSSSSSSSSSDSSSGSASDSGVNPYATEHDFLRHFLPPHLEPKVNEQTGHGTVRALSASEEALFIARGWGAGALAQTANAKQPTEVQRPVADLNPSNFNASQGPSDELMSLPYKRLYTDTNDDIAVVIGNVNYENSGIPNNDPAQRDALAFEAFATKALGVNPNNVIRVSDATQANLLRIFGDSQNPNGQLSDWVRPQQSRVYVYYAGHGAPATTEDSFLVPVDADSARLDLNGYALSTLYRNLSQLQAKQVWLVIESCFSGVAQNGAIVTNASPVFVRNTVVKPPTNVSVFSASLLDQIASWEPDQSHGLFTKYFLHGMSGEADASPFGNGDGTVNHEELNAYLKANLSYWARRYHGRDQVALIQNWSQP